MNSRKLSSLVLLVLLASWPASRVAFAQNGPMVFDANGHAIGLWRQSLGGQIATVLSTKNVMFALNLDTGEVTRQYVTNYYGCGISDEALYESSDCTGISYHATGRDPGTRCGGSLNRKNSSPHSLIVSQFDALSLERTIRSRVLSDGSCSAFPSPQQINTVPVFDNDPAATGVSNSNYHAPLTVALPSSVNCLFRDGFEICK